MRLPLRRDDVYITRELNTHTQACQALSRNEKGARSIDPGLSTFP